MVRRGWLQRCRESQGHMEGEQKELQNKVESLESIVRMLELKGKNATDHGKRRRGREGGGDGNDV